MPGLPARRLVAWLTVAAVGTGVVVSAQTLAKKPTAGARKTPIGCSVPASGVVTRTASQPRVALSIDLDIRSARDTRRMLETIDALEARATFFVLGDKVNQRKAKLYRDILRSGSELGNHTFTHRDLTALSWEENVAELSATNRLIKRMTGFRPCLMRPPFLLQDQAVSDAAASRELTVVLADAFGVDWKTKDPRQIERNALDSTKPGSILLLHNTAWSVAALPRIIRGLRARGLEVVTVTRLLGGRRVLNR